MDDATQLQTLQLLSVPIIYPFIIKPSKEGDVVDGVELMLQNY